MQVNLPSSDRTPSLPSGHVAILMCTFQSEKYLREQLDSILSQTYSDFSLWISDDSSTDSTLTIIKEYQKTYAQIKLQKGPQQGFASNFLHLACCPDIQSSYYAYADHDDIWEPDKIAKAVRWLSQNPQTLPLLYCSRTQLINASGQPIGSSSLFRKKPSFLNALVQSIGGGNTMVFNHATCQLLRQAGKAVPVISHDWWTYLVVSGCGGKVYYDSYPSLQYRQHSANLSGTNLGWKAKGVRIWMLWQGHFRSWNSLNIQSLELLSAYLLPQNAKILDAFSRARNASLLQRLVGLKKLGIYRQTLSGNLGLFVAAIFKKI